MWNETAEYIGRWREGKGFVTPSTIQGPDGDQMLGKLMLVVTEIDEMFTAVNDSNFQEERADVAIRVLDILGTTGCDIDNGIVNLLSSKTPCNYQDLSGLVCKSAEAVRSGDLSEFWLNLLKLVHAMQQTSLVPLLHVVSQKMAVNEKRPFRHGKKSTL